MNPQFVGNALLTVTILGAMFLLSLFSFINLQGEWCMRIDSIRQRAMRSLLSVTIAISFFVVPVVAADEALNKKAGDTISSFSRWVIAADYAADGPILVTVGGESLLYRPGDVILWKSEGTRIGELSGHQTAVWAVDVSADGKLVATAGYDGLIKVWDLQSRKLKRDLKQHKGWVRSLAFSPDGSRLVSAGEDGKVFLWNTQDGKAAITVAAHKGPVTAVAFSPNGKTFVTGGGDNLVKVWNAADGTAIQTLAGHEDTIWSIAYSPTRSQFVSTGADRTIRVWSAETFKQTGVFTGHKDWVTSASFNSDGSRLVTASLDGVIKLWDVQKQREQQGLKRQSSCVWCVAFKPDDQSIFIGTHSGGQIIPTPVAKLVPLPPEPSPKPVSQVVLKPLVPTEFKSLAGATGLISADGTVLVSGTNGKDTYTVTATVPQGPPVTAIRLEVLPDKTLPAQGPGRAANGNFVLSEFNAKVLANGTEKTEKIIVFTNVIADYSQNGWPVANARDQKEDTGWGIAGSIGRSHIATFQTAAETPIQGGTTLVFTMSQQFSDGQHSIGKFRLFADQKTPVGDSVQTPEKPDAKDNQKKKAPDS